MRDGASKWVAFRCDSKTMLVYKAFLKVCASPKEESASFSQLPQLSHHLFVLALQNLWLTSINLYTFSRAMVEIHHYLLKTYRDSHCSSPDNSTNSLYRCNHYRREKFHQPKSAFPGHRKSYGKSRMLLVKTPKARSR